MWLFLAAAFAAPLLCPPGSAVAVLPAGGEDRLHACLNGDAQLAGPAVVIDAQGRTLARGSFVADHREGRWTERQGALTYAGLYAGGARTGPWTATRSDGSLAFSLNYLPAPVELVARPGADPRVLRRWALPAPASQLHWMGDRLLARTGRGLIELDPDGEARLIALPGPAAGDPAADAEGWSIPLQGGDLLVVDAFGVARRNSKAGHTHVLAATAEGGWVIRDGAGRLAATTPQGDLRWRSKIAFDPVQPAATGALVVGVRDRELRALSTADGAARWSARASAPVVRLVPSYAGDLIYALDRQGEVLAFDAATGAPRWSRDLGLGAGRALGATLRDDAGGLVVIAGGQVWRLFFRDGALLNEAALPKNATTVEPDFFDGLLCAGGVDGVLRCGPPGGAARIEAPVGRLTAPPLILEDRIYVATEAGELLELDRALTQAASPAAEADAVDLRVAGVETEGRRVALEDPPCGSPPLSLGLPEAAAPDAPVEIEALSLTWEDEEAPVFDPRWTVEVEERRLTASLSALWDHQLTGATPVEASPDQLAQLDRLLRCEADRGSFLGEVVVDDIGIERRYFGQVNLSVAPSIEGCLLELTLGDEPLGAFSGVSGLARVGLLLHLDGPELDGRLPLIDAESLSFEGFAELTARWPGAPAEETREAEGQIRLLSPAQSPDLLELRDGSHTPAVLWLPGLRREPDEEGVSVEHAAVYHLIGAAGPSALLPLLRAEACPEPAAPR